MGYLSTRPPASFINRSRNPLIPAFFSSIYNLNITSRQCISKIALGYSYFRHNHRPTVLFTPLLTTPFSDDLPLNL